MYATLVAAGSVGMAADATWANTTGSVPDRLKVVADEIDILGSAVMGLTMKCARSHSHKYDPIPQRDYYRLLDFFHGTLDQYGWPQTDIKPITGPVTAYILYARHPPVVAPAQS